MPEVDETFSIQLANATGGAALAAQADTIVTILTNDAAHGLIGFAPVSTGFAIAKTLLRIFINY